MTSQPQPPEPSPTPSGLPARASVAQPHQALARHRSRASLPTSSEQSLTPSFVWRAYCQWWKWVVPLGVLLSITAGGLVWYLHIPMYEATLQIKIETDVPYIAFDKGTVSPVDDRYIETQLEMIQGSVVLDKVLARPDIGVIDKIREQDDPINFLQENLSIKQVGKSQLYEVSYISSSPREAKTITEAIVAEYINTQNRFESDQAQLVISKLASIAKLREDELKQLRTEVVSLAEEVTGKDPFGQGVVIDVAAFSPAASMYSSLVEADVNLAVMTAELQALRDAPILVGDQAVSSGLLELEIANRPDIRQLEERFLAINQQAIQVKDKPRTKIGDTWEKDPEYIRLHGLAGQVRAELDSLKSSAKKELSEYRAQERKAEEQRRIVEKEREISALTQRRDLLAKQFQEQLQKMKEGGAQSAKFALKKGELDRKEKVFEMIAVRRLALETEREAPARVSLYEKSARLPAVAIEPIPYKALLIACSLALFAPMALAVGRETIIKRIASPEQLAMESLLPVLGEVARFPVRQVNATQHKLSTAKQRELFIFAESIDGLRTNLMLTENLGVPGQRKLIAICSAASGEGKTSIATALAMSIAEATKQCTLVIDADLRAPDIADFLGVPNHPGLVEVLSGKASLAQAIHRVGETQAYVMPAGKLRVNPHHVLQGSKIDNLLSTLREKFSTVVIDTPPVLSASESLVYARAADLVVFCSLADVSRSKQVRVAVDRLQATGANIAGAVLSGVEVSRYVYNYGSYDRTA